MSSNWTFRRAARGALTALVLLCLPACSQNEGNRNEIRPLKATIAIEPVFANPAVFFVENFASTSSLILLDVMLRSSNSVDFDAFTLEIHYLPGIVGLGGDPVSSGITETPFGRCNEPDTINCSAPAADPLCTSTADSAGSTGELIIGVAANTGQGCPPMTFGGGEIKLMTIGFVPAGTGQSTIRLVGNTSTSGDGQCEILKAADEVSPPIPCLDGNATFTATR